MLSYDSAQKALTIAPEGELDHFMAQNMREAIDDMVRKTGATALIFDMANVSFMDSSGIGMLIGRYKLMQARGGGVRIRGMRMTVARIFNMAGLRKIIKIDDESCVAGVSRAGGERMGNK